MRERWVDHGEGLFVIETDTVRLSLWSRAPKNYRTIHSHWNFRCLIKGRYGYACNFYHDFGGTFNEAFERAETIIREMFESVQEII